MVLIIYTVFLFSVAKKVQIEGRSKLAWLCWDAAFLRFLYKDKAETHACQTDNFYLCIDRIYITRSNPLFIMTLQQLEYILAVSQFRHFAKAAEHCRVTQPTLSAMIQKLEDELDTKIFDRSQQPICPTPVGQLVIEQARIVLEQAGHIKDIIEEEKHSLSGVFKLGILPTIAPLPVAPLLSATDEEIS